MALSHPALSVLLLGAFLAGLSGCASGTRPASYNCDAGCWTTLQLTHAHTDTSGAADLDGPRITGVSSDLLLAPLSCDDACRSSSGDLANPGFIATEMCLYESDNKAWACAGYRTDAGGAPQYFVWFQVPGAKTFVVGLGSTPPSPDAGKYAHAIVTISSASDANSGASFWIVFVESHPATTSSYFVYDYLLPFTLSSFQPTAIQYTQFVQGASGATADPAIFANNRYGTALTHDGATPTSLSPDWQVLKHDGVLSPTGTATNPSSAGWSRPPSGSTDGGRFVMWCCASAAG
jgi:hypothetical protein